MLTALAEHATLASSSIDSQKTLLRRHKSAADYGCNYCTPLVAGSEVKSRGQQSRGFDHGERGDGRIVSPTACWTRSVARSLTRCWRSFAVSFTRLIASFNASLATLASQHLCLM